DEGLVKCGNPGGRLALSSYHETSLVQLVSFNQSFPRRAKMAVSYIPAGQHSVTPHLVIRGAAKAIEFYKKAFGAVEVMRMPGPDGEMLGHAEIKIGDSHIF